MTPTCWPTSEEIREREEIKRMAKEAANEAYEKHIKGKLGLKGSTEKPAENDEQ